MVDRTIYRFGPFVLDPAEALLSHNYRRVPLTPKMFETLLALVKSRRRVLDKRELLGMLWPNTFVEENNLTQNISRLRRVLGKISKRTYIETVPKRGYRFAARVKATWDHGNDPPVKELASAHASVQPHQTEAADPKGSPSVQSSQEAPLRSIAVLPFVCLGAKGNDESLGVGLPCNLMTRLGRIEQVAVRSWAGILEPLDEPLDPLKVGRELQVDFVLQGQFQRFDHRIRVTTQLVRVSDGVLVWTTKFDEEFTDIFTVEDSISEQIAHAFALQSTGQ